MVWIRDRDPDYAVSIGGAQEESTGQEPSVAFVEEAGYWLHLIRAIEEAGRRLYLQGRLPGSFYDGRGQEATAVGAAMAMSDIDIACPLIRDMAVHLVRGVSAAEMLRHYLGKAGGPMEGADGNIHLGAFRRGTIPMISHLPEMLSVGLGVALSRTRRGQPSVALGFCGDGATCAGVFHETLNVAAVWRAPLVVVVERNHYAYMTPEDRYLPVPTLISRAAGYGIESATVDGNDVLAVNRTVGSALAYARNGGGPVLIEAFTYRMHGHGAHDAQRYVPDGEIDYWAQRDPIDVWRQTAIRYCGWSEADHDAMTNRVQETVEQALAEAQGAPYPSTETLGSRVFA
jgi:pyruvate dehydrogenase E1 component alpha subunit